MTTEGTARNIGAAGEPTLLEATPGLDVLTPGIVQCASRNFTDHGGPKVTAPVQVLYWGKDWSAVKNPDNPSELYADALTAAVQSILSGPWMSGLRQYGVNRCTFGGARIVDSSEPPTMPDQYDKGDVAGMIQGLINDGIFPEPDEPGGRNLYAVFMPPRTSPAPVDGMSIDGEHSHFQSGSLVDADVVWYAFVAARGTPGSLNNATSDFCHELAEMCTDPTNDGWKIDGASTGCTEIADVCNKISAMVNGVNVSAYWSKIDNACLITTTWSVRRTLTYAGKRLNGQGLRSLQNPIPSLERFIVDI
jgi:hypothetical protein